MADLELRHHSRLRVFQDVQASPGDFRVERSTIQLG